MELKLNKLKRIKYADVTKNEKLKHPNPLNQNDETEESVQLIDTTDGLNAISWTIIKTGDQKEGCNATNSSFHLTFNALYVFVAEGLLSIYVLCSMFSM